MNELEKTQDELFLQLKQDELLFGDEHHRYVNSSRSRWLGVSNLMQDLGINTDFNLPESKEVLEIINQLYNKELESVK